MSTNKSELIFVLDKSGSMNGLESDTIGGFNSTIEAHKKLGSDVRVTTVLFDTNIELLHDRIDIEALSPLTTEQFQVGGMTALLDAIGVAIHKIRNVHKQTAPNHQPEQVIVVIITDGHENSSKEYLRKDIKKLIKHQQDKYGWEFLFLGANIDAVSEADSLGIHRDSSVQYDATAMGVALAWKQVTSYTANRRKK